MMYKRGMSSLRLQGSAPALGVNIDHIATLRQLRGTPYPDLIEAARCVEAGGGQQITVHLREDRRHIQDEDVKRLRAALNLPLNLEMAATEPMLKFARKVHPDWACLVPEKRQELTTEGGLALEKNKRRVGSVVQALKKVGIRVSLFVEPSVQSVRLSQELGADAVELHTGRYCLETQKKAPQGDSGRPSPRASAELTRIAKAVAEGRRLGLKVHAGHGLDYGNVRALLELEISEYNIGHSIVCRAALVGLERAVREMVSAIAAP
jgi:pyridoxine 5-phosphate synthase